MKETAVAMRHITKDFSGVKVLKNVDFNIYNGRGKINTYENTYRSLP